MADQASETHFIGPMGSEFWQIRVPPELVPALAREFDWNRLGRRVLVDARAGIIAWMSPASTHEVLAEETDAIVLAAGQIIKGGVWGMRGTRWKRPEDPRNTGLEADASYYIGAKAEQWFTLTEKIHNGELAPAARADFAAITPPDLVVEVEITNLDKDKPARYARLGVQELWQVNRKQDQTKIEVTILELQKPGGAMTVRQSRVLPGLRVDALPRAYQLAGIGKFAELQTLLQTELVVPPTVQKAEPPRRGPRM